MSWDERATAATQLLARWVESRHTAGAALEIADVGSGNERLRGILLASLPCSIRYHAYDLHPQSARVTKLDVQRQMPDRRFDVVFCLGLLEYLADVESVARRLQAVCTQVIVSYVISDSEPRMTDADRAARGWRNHHTQAELEAIFDRAGFALSEAVETGDRTVVWRWENV